MDGWGRGGPVGSGALVGNLCAADWDNPRSVALRAGQAEYLPAGCRRSRYFADGWWLG
jgi:hypothetical protein